MKWQCALAAFVFTAPALAQQQPATTVTETLSLADALAAARRNVPSVLAAAGAAQSAHGEVALAASARLPVVAGNATLGGLYQNSDSYGGSSTGTGGGIPCSSGMVCGASHGPLGYAYLDVGVNARWTIWDFGRTALNVRAAERDAAGADADVRGAERAAVATAATAYFALLADFELVDSARATVTQRERELEIARARVQVGADPAINATRAEVAASTARLDEETAEATAQNDAASLAAALGLDPVHPPRVTRPAEVQVDETPEQAAAEALRARPEFAAAMRRVEAAEADVAAARAGWRPSLTATGTIGGRYTEYTTASSVLNESAQGLVTFSVPIFDASIPANVRIAEGRLVTARAQLMEQSLAVRTDAVQATLAVRAARQQLEQAEHNAALAAANLELSEGRYQAGAAQLLELIDAQAQDTTARLAVIQRRFQLGAATVRLLAAVGHLDRLGGS